MWWSNSRIGGAGSMPLGFITLLSGKGGRCDETKRKLTFFSSFPHHSRHLTLFVLGFHDECCSRVIHGIVCHDCTIVVCVLLLALVLETFSDSITFVPCLGFQLASAPAYMVLPLQQKPHKKSRYEDGMPRSNEYYCMVRIQ